MGAAIAGAELSARRAVNGWWYMQNGRARGRGYYWGGASEGWKIRISWPRKGFVRSVAPAGRSSRYAHRVRDVLVATRFDQEFRMVRYLCGAYTWHGVLSWETDTVCKRCETAYEGAGGQVELQ
jgi:hypothetical protein